MNCGMSHKQKRWKFDEKVTEGIFIGYDLRSTGYWIHTSVRKRVVSKTVNIF